MSWAAAQLIADAERAEKYRAAGLLDMACHYEKACRLWAIELITGVCPI